MQQSATFERWMRGLRDRGAVARINARLLRIEAGHFGDVRPLGDGVLELRIHYGPGYRLYLYTPRRNRGRAAMRWRQGRPAAGYRTGQAYRGRMERD